MRGDTINTLFIDRDGTINVEKGYVHEASDFEYVPGSLEALRLATRHRFGIYIVTNQAGIARGMYSEKQFLDFTRTMLDGMAREGVAIARVLYCPHHPDGVVPQYRLHCDCRKPASGLLQRAIAEASLSSKHAAMIGDKNSDVEAGRRLGMRTYLVETGYGLAEKAVTSADHVVTDLLAAVRHVISRNESSNS